MEAAKRLAAVLETPFFVAALIGWFLLGAEARRRAWPVAAILLVWTAVHVVSVSATRLAEPVEYYKIMLASPVLLTLWNSGARRFARGKR